MSDSAPQHRRLGIYFEIPFRRDEDGFSTHVPFIRFVLALRPHFDGLVLIGRVDPKPGREHYAIPDDVEVAALLHEKIKMPAGSTVVCVLSGGNVNLDQLRGMKWN